MEDFAFSQERTLFKWNPQQPLDIWLLLHGVSGFGFQKLKQLAALANADMGNLMGLSATELALLGLPFTCVQSGLQKNKAHIEKVKAWLAESELHAVLPFNHPEYPAKLREIASPPLLLFCVGNRSALNQPQMAVVGSRKLSPAGSQICRQISADLVASGWVVTSGLALGIDTQAHYGALDKEGLTVAVMATGIDMVYPRRNQQLAKDIVARQGCLVTEFPPGVGPKKEHFPRRNRIISGLSNGVLVVEAAIKSGSLITARYALEQNREVFAIPGSVYNLNSQGCHYLIKQGAKLVEQVIDINEEFPNLKQISQNYETKKPEKNCKLPLATDRLLASVGFEATSIDVVAQRSGLPVTAVMSELLEYELRGLVAAVPGGYIRLGE